MTRSNRWNGRGVLRTRSLVDGVRGPSSSQGFQLDRQVLAKEEAAPSLLLAGVVQGVGREAGLPLGGRGYLHLEVEPAGLDRLGLGALWPLEQTRVDRPPLGAGDP